MKKLLKTALLSLTLSTGLTLSTLALAGDAEFIAESCGGDSACVAMLTKSFADAAEHSAKMAAETSAVIDGPGPAVSDMGTTESPGETSAVIDGPGPAVSTSAERSASRALKAALLKRVKGGELTLKEAAEVFRDGAPGPEPGESDKLIESMVFDLKESERSEEEYESMTDLEREIHEEGRELTAEERADLGDFNAVEDGVLDKFGTGPVDPTELAKALKAEGAALGIDVKITYTKEASGLGCFGANSATGEFGPISCSETAESLDDCGGSMASDYKSGTMKCKGFTVVGTKIK